MRRVAALFLLVLLLAQAVPASAQTTGGSAAFTAVDANNFPEMFAYLSVTDAAGQPASGLGAAAFQLTENQTPITNVSVLEAEMGLQVVFVMDVNLVFKARDANGVNRLGYIKEALTSFAQQTLAEVDDITLITPEGQLIAHVNSGAPVVDALNRYTPSYAGSAAPLDLLNTGLNFASDATPRPGMRRAVVYLANGLPLTGGSAALTDLTARAQAAHVTLHTVYVGPLDTPEAASGQQTLSQLSRPTAGLSLALQDPKSLTPLFKTLVGQRRQYRLSYRSSLNVTGQHSLSVQVQLADGRALTASPASFQLRVQPPVVAAVNWPTHIDLARLSSSDYALPVQITFPDGHPRNLRQAQLWVDGQPVVHQPAADVAAFTWPLNGYTASLTHTVQVSITDELGLSAASPSAAIFLISPSAASPAAASPPSPWPNTVGLILGALALVLLLIGGGAVVWFRRAREAAPVGRASSVGGETRPLRPVAPRPARDPSGLKPAEAVRRLHLPQLSRPRFGATPRPGQPKAFGRAYLEVVEAGSGGSAEKQIELPAGPLRIGRDPNLVEALFRDRSVSRLHARIVEVEPGCFQIFDEGSTSGTWVNYAQVSNGAGVALQTGDLINLGRVQLRFQVRPGLSPSEPAPGARLT